MSYAADDDLDVDEREGHRRAKEVMLEALVEVDLPVDARRRVLAKLREVLPSG